MPGGGRRRRGRPSGAKPGAARRPPRHWVLWLGAILAVTFAVYIPCLDNGFTNWDDNHYVTTNRILPHAGFRDVLTTPIAGNYHPLTIWSLALNYRISGLDPASYHWLSLLLHLANTALVFFFVWRLSGGRLWASIVTGLFFGIHPMHVESVAWVAERKDVLYAFFCLLGLIAYLEYLERRRPAWLWISLLAAVLSTASKPAAVVFPLTLWAIDFFRRRRFGMAVVVEKLPFLAVSLAGGILTLTAQQSAGAIAEQWNLVQRVLFASYGTVMYVAKLFVPLGLSALYPTPNNAASDLDPEFYVSFAALVILLPAVVYLFRRSRPVLFGLMFFFINIALVLQFVTVGQAVMAERYTYLPYIGLLFALSWWLDSRPGEIPGKLPARGILAGCFVLLLPLSLAETWKRCDVWKDSETLWNDTIRKFPEAARAWNFKGVTMAEQDRYDLAYDCFDRAVTLKPNYAEALNNRAAVKLRRNDAAGALADVEKAIELNRIYRDAYANRSIARSMLGDVEGSILDSRRAIELDPANPRNYQEHGAIGGSLTRLGRYREAIADYDAAIRGAPPSEPRLGAYYLNRSTCWAALGDRARALSDAREARRLGAAVDPAYIAGLGG